MRRDHYALTARWREGVQKCDHELMSKWRANGKKPRTTVPATWVLVSEYVDRGRCRRWCVYEFFSPVCEWYVSPYFFISSFVARFGMPVVRQIQIVTHTRQNPYVYFSHQMCDVRCDRFHLFLDCRNARKKSLAIQLFKPLLCVVHLKVVQQNASKVRRQHFEIIENRYSTMHTSTSSEREYPE